MNRTLSDGALVLSSARGVLHFTRCRLAQSPRFLNLAGVRGSHAGLECF